MDQCFIHSHSFVRPSFVYPKRSFWMIILFCFNLHLYPFAYIIYHKIQMKFNFHYGSWYCTGVMPLENGKFSRIDCFSILWHMYYWSSNKCWFWFSLQIPFRNYVPFKIGESAKYLPFLLVCFSEPKLQIKSSWLRICWTKWMKW